jgi:hypothetical protein
MQRPLRAVVVVPPNCPCLCLRLDQRLQGLVDGGFLPMPALPYPRGIDMLRHVVCVRIGEEPCYEGGQHGREYKSSRTRQRTPRNAHEGRVIVSSARLAYWPDGVYVSGNEKEYRYCAATADGKTEEGQLEDGRWLLGAVGRLVQPWYQRST